MPVEKKGAGIIQKTLRLLESNRMPILIFFSSLFIFLSLAGTRMLFSDEGIIVNQFYNFVHGSLDLKVAKVNVERGIYITVENQLYGRFSYSLLILSTPVYLFLKNLDLFYGAHLFLLQLWALSGGISVYLLAKNWKMKNSVLIGLISYFILILVNLRFFDPIYFPKWGEIISIEFTNILLTSFMVLLIYFLFRDIFSEKIGLFTSLFIMFATPIPFYALTLKHHTLAIFLTVMVFYLFYKYQEKRDTRFIYPAYVLAGLCIWTRISEGAALLLALFVMDMLFIRRSIKHITIVLVIIVISLVPFFTFNQLILRDPFSIMESHPLSITPMKMQIEENMIVLNSSPLQARQVELLDQLGFNWSPDVRTGTMDVILDISIRKLGNTFGILLISPFLITAFAFLIDRIKRKIKLSGMDTFMGLYAIIFVVLHKDYFLLIITDTPIVIEYRYLLIMYVILLYFALRTIYIKDMIENNLRKIILLYVIIVMILLSYFIMTYPPPIMNLYYPMALVTASGLLILSAVTFLTGKSGPLDKLTIFFISLSLALASFMMIFYYWVVTITYISPSQNYTILPILKVFLEWMYQALL